MHAWSAVVWPERGHAAPAAGVGRCAGRAAYLVLAAAAVAARRRAAPADRRAGRRVAGAGHVCAGSAHVHDCRAARPALAARRRRTWWAARLDLRGALRRHQLADARLSLLQPPAGRQRMRSFSPADRTQRKPARGTGGRRSLARARWWDIACLVSVVPIPLWMLFSPGFHDTLAAVTSSMGSGAAAGAVF